MRKRWEARSRWRITGAGQIALGPGKVDLLEAIDRTGSISGAARELDMSYRRAWLLVETMNRCFVRPLVVTARWRGRGASLSDLGRKALRLYREMEGRSQRAVARPLRRLLKNLRPAPPAPGSSGTRNA